MARVIAVSDRGRLTMAGERKSPRVRVSWGELTCEQRETWGVILSGLAQEGLLVSWANDVLERVFIAGVDGATAADAFGFELPIGEALEVLGVRHP